MIEERRALSVLTLNTVAFTVCFAAWMLNGVLVSFLVTNGVYAWTDAQVGWLLGTPVLSGSLARLPVGVLTDRYGGRPVYVVLLLVSAVMMWLVSTCHTYGGFLAASLGFGLSGASFAVGIAYTSIWFKREHQGTALGIFGVGNAGSALTSIYAPRLLNHLTRAGEDLERWRLLPQYYAAALAVTAVVFLVFTHSKRVDDAATKTIWQRLEPLKVVRVWRFGLYYFLVFGGFVALAQWLLPYYVNVYGMTVARAGLMAAVFSFPSGVVRALGGWLSDRFGARRVMYWILGACLVCCTLLIVPRMEIQSPGKGVMASRDGLVEEVRPDAVVVSGRAYTLKAKPDVWLSPAERDTRPLIWPVIASWQEPAVSVGEHVAKKQLLARGLTAVYFQANVWVFTGLVFLVGFAMGIGKAAVYKHIPDYFPNDIGVVGGIVGVLGGLGGFVGPIVFGYLLQMTGIWTTCWVFFAMVTAVCLCWMHLVIQQMMRREQPELMREMDESARFQGDTGDER